MHPEQAAILQTISENPGDDTVRLIFADWLEERGDTTRAQFIRYQIDAHQRPWTDPQRGRLDAIVRQMLLDHEAIWRLERPEIAGVRRLGYYRGWCDHFSIDDASALRHADRLFESGPVDELVFDRIDEQSLGLLIGCPYLSRVRSLRFNPHAIRPVDLVGFLMHAQLDRLEQLVLRDQGIYNEVPIVLAEQAHLPNLRRLDLSVNYIGQPGIERFAQSSRLPSLSYLSLFRNRIGDAGVEALTHAPHLQELDELELQNTYLGDKGCVALAKSNLWKRSRTLNLCYNRIGNKGAQAIANCSHLSDVEILVLRANSIKDAGAVALAQSPHLRNLKSLEINCNPFKARGRERLISSFSERVHFE